LPLGLNAISSAISAPRLAVPNVDYVDVS
jgi:hypothetical protein